jgi:GNAT superfamily N-acetyltransferase
MTADDLEAADLIYRVAFGTFVGAPDPQRFGGDTDFVATRFAADPSGALAAEAEGRLVGSNFVADWGSVGFFGPLTVTPELWDRGVGRSLLDATMDLFAARGTRHAGLFTFSYSTKHVSLYQRYGFWPRMLTALMTKPVAPDPAAAAESPAVDLRAIGKLTDAVYPGLDLTREVESVQDQGLGAVVAVGEEAVAICHVGPGSEAGSGHCYVKFGAARPGPDADRQFRLLLAACERVAASNGAATLVAGVSAGCDRAWAAMRESGFRPTMLGVAMHKPNDSGYHTSENYVIDDWR